MIVFPQHIEQSLLAGDTEAWLPLDGDSFVTAVLRFCHVDLIQEILSAISRRFPGPEIKVTPDATIPPPTRGFKITRNQNAWVNTLSPRQAASFAKGRFK